MTDDFKAILMETQTFPSHHILKLASKYKLRIEAHEHYQKRSFRNKYIIATEKGPLALSIPLKKGKNNGMRITEVEIAYDVNWPEVHLRTIQAAYGKSAFYLYYKDELEEILQSRTPKLFELNWKLLQWMLDQMNIQTELDQSSKYVTPLQAPEIDFRNQFLPANYAEFESRPYRQVFLERTGFQANLSGLDLLFNLGPESEHFLHQQ